MTLQINLNPLQTPPLIIISARKDDYTTDKELMKAISDVFIDNNISYEYSRTQNIVIDITNILSAKQFMELIELVTKKNSPTLYTQHIEVQIEKILPEQYRIEMKQATSNCKTRKEQFEIEKEFENKYAVPCVDLIDSVRKQFLNSPRY